MVRNRGIKRDLAEETDLLGTMLTSLDDLLKEKLVLFQGARSRMSQPENIID
ncbi:hypothetical protein MUP59_07495 [Candidatus Bathyarchaeota archaeon]|nr:hypothetical protein [Candidatus Bathyarchaeota archaeon]